MIVIIGAGISGLSVADNLRKNFITIEKNNYPGGLCTQYKSDKYWFDFSGHYFHFAGKEKIKEYVNQFSRFSKYKRDSRIYMFNKFIPYPVQYHLSYFPEEIRRKVPEEIQNSPKRVHRNLKESLLDNFGETLYKIFFSPFMTKYYRMDLSGIIPEMDRGSIPVPDAKSIEEGLSGKQFSDRGYNPVFYYPRENLKVFIANLEKNSVNRIKYNEEVLKIDIIKKIVSTNKGKYGYSSLVNTMPLKDLIKRLDPKPGWAFDPESLQSVSTLVVNLILKEKRKKFHWVYLPESDTVFYRAGYYPSHPDSACYLERSVIDGDIMDYDDVKSGAISILKKLDMIGSASEILHMDIKMIPNSYVIFNRDWKEMVPPVLESLRNNNIYSIGRYGTWNYSSMSDDIRTGMETADVLNRLK